MKRFVVHVLIFSVVATMGLGWRVYGQKSTDRRLTGQLPGVELPTVKTIQRPLVEKWPGSIVTLLQSRKYDEARKAIDTLESGKKPESAEIRAFHDLVRAISFRLEGKPALAIELIQKRLKEDPDTDWTTKLRGELAQCHLSAGRAEDAQLLAKADVDRLLSASRKDSLANVYRGFARKLLEPVEALTQPDYAGAVPFLIQARDVAESESLKNDLTYQLARLYLDQGQPASAVSELITLTENEKRRDIRHKVKFDLGLAEFRAGQTVQARRTWSDLLRELEKEPKDAFAGLSGLKADCLYAQALTWSLPFQWETEKKPYVATTPVLQIDASQAANVARAVSAGIKALQADPANSRSVRVAYAMASVQMQNPAEAATRFRAFLEGKQFREESEIARKDLLELRPKAQFQLAMALRRIEKFDEAQNAFRDYALKYPDGADSASALQAVIDIEVDKANRLYREKDFNAFRNAIRQFVTANPLQLVVPQLLYRIGESFSAEKNWKEAVSAWEVLGAKFPEHTEADHARYESALAYETQIGDLPRAIEVYRSVRIEPWRSQALQRIAIMEQKSLTVITPRVFRSNEVAKLKVSTRNIEKLSFSAYRIDAESYFRKKLVLGQVDQLDIGLVKPDAEWSVDVPGHARYKPVDLEYELKTLELPGVWVVKVTDEKSYQATTLVIGSDIDAIVKTSRDQLLVYAQNMLTGEALSSAAVLVSDGNKVLVEAKTGSDGVLLKDWPASRPNRASHRVLVFSGQHIATLGNAAVPNVSARGLSAKAMILTDRPAYRPGQTVELRGIVREVQNSRYDAKQGAAYTLEVSDSRGRQLVSRSVKLSEYGTFSESLPLDQAAALGQYTIRLFQPSGSSFGGSFRVEEYELPKVVMDLNLPSPIVERGDMVKGKVTARYSYGTPLTGRQIRVQLPTGLILELKTDKAGTAEFEFSTEELNENSQYTIIAQMPEEGVTASSAFAIPGASFTASLKTVRSTYLVNEPISIGIHTDDALGKPTGQSMELVLIRRVQESGRQVEQEVSRKKVQTDTKTGDASEIINVTDRRGGTHVLRVLGADSFGRPVTSEIILDISGEDDPNGLRLLADQTTWKMGTDASAMLFAREKGGPILLCFEADRILGYQILKAKEGQNPLSWKVAENHFPNLTLTATRMRDQKQDLAKLEVRVQRGLNVQLKPLVDSVKPGEPFEVQIQATDQNGKPASAELSLSLVDKALLRLFADDRPDIQKFFYDQSRLGAFQSVATNGFRYSPATVAVPESIIEEDQLQEALLANQASRGEARGRAQMFAGRAANAPPASATADALSRDQQSRGYFKSQEGQIPMPAMVAPASRAPASGGGMGGMMGTTIAGKPAQAERKDDPFSSKLKSARREMAADKELAENDRFFGGQEVALGLMDEKLAMPARERTIETAYWNPSIITDSSGNAKIRIIAPNALGEYQFTGIGVTSTETLVGQAQAVVDVRKPFFIELIVPSHLTEGDQLIPRAKIHHSGINGEVKVTLERYFNGQRLLDPKSIKISDDGVTEIQFDPFVIPATQEVRFQITAEAGGQTDTEIVSVPANPWGTPVLVSEHGSGREDQTVLIQLPEGQKYESRAMMISLSPTLQRQVLEAAFGSEIWPLPRERWACIIPPPWNTTSDRAADLMAACSALSYVKQVGGTNQVDQAKLTGKIQGLVSELVSRQNDDGGWPITVSGSVRIQQPQNTQQSDPTTSAKVLLALAMASQTGVARNENTLNQAAAYVQSSGNAARPWNSVALAYVGKIGFEELNALSRNREQLDSSELAALILSWKKLDRVALAEELLKTLLSRSRTSPAKPAQSLQRFWPAGVVGQEMTTAWAAWALSVVRPSSDELPEVIHWLNQHRFGPSWLPYETKGAAVSAMAEFYGRAEASQDRYRMAVRVNGVLIEEFNVDGADSPEVRVWNVPVSALKDGENRVSFDVEGRARFGFGVELSGFSRDYASEQKRDGKPFVINRREYLAADPELDGEKLPTGFSTAINPATFKNLLTMLPVGNRTVVNLEVVRIPNAPVSRGQGDLLVIEEPIPSGARLVEGSIQGQQLLRVEQDRGLIRFFVDPARTSVENIRYELFGAFPGQSRIRPARVYRISERGLVHASSESSLRILKSDEKSTDPYRPTPDELYARGQKHFAKGRLTEAAKDLELLTGDYTLQDGPARESARMLLDAHIAAGEPRKIVQDFEILKQKAPDLVIPIDKIRTVGDSYAAIGESERAWLVWKAVLEAGYLDETRLGQTLRQTNRPLEAAAYLLKVWQAYPGSASQQSDFFGLSRWLSQIANDSVSQPILRRELLNAGITRSELITQAISLSQLFLTLSPADPLGDEASLALIGDLSTLEANESVIQVAVNAASIYPKSRFLDSFQFGEALARYNLGEWDKAIDIGRRIAQSTYEDPSGVRIPSPNKPQAHYVMGQIFDARRQFAEALKEYHVIKGQFPDAAVAVRAIERKSLKMPEVSVVQTTTGTKAITAKFQVDYRNISSLDLKVYPVDLMRLYLTKRNLDQIAAVDLAGIKPLNESTVKLTGGKPFSDESHEISLPLPGEGAYLVMIRGAELFTSGIVLATPIELEVLEEAAEGRVRVSARESGTGKPLSKIQVKLSGSVDGRFRDGQTDLRGVYVAEGLSGLVTIVARESAGRFAFYRGKTAVGGTIVQEFRTNQPSRGATQNAIPSESQQLDQNLRGLNRANEMKQIERLEQRYNLENRSKGVQIQSVK